MKRVRTLAILNLLALLVHITFSYLTQFGLVNNRSVGEVSDAYDSLFTPASLTFAIWGVIYTALMFFCVYHLRVAFKQGPTHPDNKAITRIGIWFILNNAAAIAWLIVWTAGMIQVSVLLIFFQLVTLILVNLRLGIHDPTASVASKIFTQFPLSIYFGWLAIAAVANTSVCLVAMNWNGFGFSYTPVEWTRIVVGVVVLITVLVIFTRQNVFFGLVISWGLYGIILKRTSIDPFIYRELIKTIWIGMAIVIVSCAIQFILNISTKQMPNVPRGLHHS